MTITVPGFELLSFLNEEFNNSKPNTADHPLIRIIASFNHRFLLHAEIQYTTNLRSLFMISIALVGDYSKKIVAHTAIPRALELASSVSEKEITGVWIATSVLNSKVENLADFHAIWLVPGSPYASMEGALNAVRFARESKRPFIGTCGGFQHALIEYARNVCGIRNATHAETNPDDNELIITPLSCSMVEKTGNISFTKSSRLYSILNGENTMEEYHCNYGLNEKWQTHLEARGIQFTGFDMQGEIRAFELPAHPFFIGTLFQPERLALHGKLHPIVRAFCESAT